jgi:hypothetical protein
MPSALNRAASARWRDPGRSTRRSRTETHRADRLLELERELFGHQARWMSEPDPFLGDLDAIYRRRWTVPAS